MKHQALFAFLLVVVALSSLQAVMADTGPMFDVSGYAYGSNANVASCSGFTILTNSDITITGIGVATSSGATRVFVYPGNVSSGTGSCTGSQYNGSVSGTTATLSKNVTISAGGLFTVLADAAGAAYSVRYDTSPSTPRNGNSSVLIWKNGVDNAGLFDHFARNVRGVYFTGNVSNVSGPAIITLSLVNVVNSSSWPTTVTFSNVTGTLNFSYFNITNGGFCVSYTGNGTGTNCTTTGSGASTFFNVTNNSVVITTTQSVSASSYQALLSVQSYRLFLNTSILAFNGTNDKVTNITSSGISILPALNGSNNLMIRVAGNYSKNVSCAVTTPLETVFCNVTGIYDNLFTIGVTNSTSSTSVNSFSATMSNTTIGALVSASTSTGNVTFQTIQGYDYFFVVNATNLEIANATRPSNNATNLYNFSLRTANTFNFTFWNETTNTRITENVTLQIVSGSFAMNYTVTNGSINISLLTPGDYAITYWLDPDVPRNYFYTLSAQSYNDIKLYIVDESISNLYLPIIINGNTVPLSNVTVQLLRDYIISGSTHAYSIVEMARTDTNGQAVLRVVPNIVDYKLIFTSGSSSLSTTPTKFTANTNTYTFNVEGNPTTSLVGYENIGKSLTFDNSTLTYTFTWSDLQNIVSAGCLQVLKFKAGVQSTIVNGCVAGSSGSITQTINDTNQSSYVATASLTTNTQFSTLSAGSISTSFVTAFSTFGLVGFIIAIIVFLTFVFVGGESGIAGALISGGIAVLILGGFGFLAASWSSVAIPIVIIIAIIVYKLRS